MFKDFCRLAQHLLYRLQIDCFWGKGYSACARTVKTLTEICYSIMQNGVVEDVARRIHQSPNTLNKQVTLVDQIDT